MILSLGSINVDVQMRVDEHPELATTMTATDLAIVSGGKAANVAYLVARLGGEARLLGTVGRDDFAAVALRGPADAGADVTPVVRSDSPTGVASVVVPPGGDKTIFRVAGANDDWPIGPDEVAAAVEDLPAGSVVVADLEAPPELIAVAVRTAADRGLTVVVDPAPPERMDDDLAAQADHLTPDAHEAAELTGVDTSTVDGALEAATLLHRRGVRCSHVKLGDGGSVLVDADGQQVLHAPGDLDVVDANGAGDAFAAGLAWALHEGADARTAARWAVAASACAVQAYGSQRAYPTLAELQRMFDRVRVGR